MMKLLFIALLAGAGYIAFAVPYEGRTVATRIADRANCWLEHDSDDPPSHPARRAPAETAHVDHHAAAHTPAARSTEEITRDDRAALDRLIPH